MDEDRVLALVEDAVEAEAWLLEFADVPEAGSVWRLSVGDWERAHAAFHRADNQPGVLDEALRVAAELLVLVEECGISVDVIDDRLRWPRRSVAVRADFPDLPDPF